MGPPDMGAPPPGYWSPAQPPAAQPKRSPVVILVAAVVVALLALGGTVFALRDRLFGGDSGTDADANIGGQPGLTVYGTEYVPLGAWGIADGFTESWQYDGASVGVVGPSTVVVLPTTSTTRPDAGAFVGVDRATGEVRWVDQPGTTDSARFCEPVPWKGYAVCWDDRDGGGRPPFLLSLETGQRTAVSGAVKGDWAVSGGALYLLEQYSAYDSGDFGADSRYVLSRWTTPDGPQWTTTYYDPTPYCQLSAVQVDDLVFACYHVFDAGDGTLLTGGCWGAGLFGGNRFTCLDDAGAGTVTVPLAGGRKATKASAAGALLFVGEKRPDTLLLWDDHSRTALSRFSGSLTSPDWTTQIPMSYPVAAWDGADRVFLLGDDGGTALISLSDGEVLWKSKVSPFPEPMPEAAGIELLDIVFVGDAIWVQDRWDHYPPQLIDATTGETKAQEYQFPGLGAVSAVPAVGTHTSRGDSHVAAVRAGSAADVPQGFPSCPSDTEVIGWTQYPDGLVLVCGTDTSFHVFVTHKGEDLAPTNLTFAPWGWTVTCKDGTVLTVGLGGGYVTVGDGSWGGRGWSRATGRISFPQVAVEACPPDTVPLSLSTWNGGWLLVCGKDLKTPTFAQWDDAIAGTGTSTDVTTNGAGYCINAGAICAGPGEAVLSDTGGLTVQRPVGADWFTTTGPGVVADDDQTVVSINTDLLFEFGSADVTPASADLVRRAVATAPPGVTIQVTGHCDGEGDDVINLPLSQRRAAAVAAIIKAERPDLQVEAIGRGSADPVAQEINPDGTDNPEGRALNRRVEIRYAG